MATQKQNPFVDLIKGAVGLPTSTVSCCGPRLPAEPVTPPATESEEQEKAATCACQTQAGPSEDK